MNTRDWPYHYLAHVVRVIDGDTVLARVDLGFHVNILSVALRLDGYNAPDVSTPLGNKAKYYLEELIRFDPLYIHTREIAINNMTRYIADAFIVGPDGNLISVAKEMRAAGFHVPRPVKTGFAFTGVAAKTIDEYVDFLFSEKFDEIS